MFETKGSTLSRFTVTGIKFSTPLLTALAALTYRLPNKIYTRTPYVLRRLMNTTTTPSTWAGEAKNYHPKHTLAYVN